MHRQRGTIDPVSERPTADQIRAFVTRGWAEVRASKEALWAEQARAQTPSERLQRSSEMWSYVRRLHPDWPTPAQREADLAHHVRLAETLRRVAHVFAGR
jgi:hypothetical protein